MGAVMSQSRFLRTRLLLIICMGFSSLAWAQESTQAPPPPVQQSESSSKKSQTTDQKSSEPAGDTSSSSGGAPQFLQMGKASPLPGGRASALQWGPVYVQSADAYQFADFISLDNPEAIPGAGGGFVRSSATYFQTNVVLDHTFRRARFAIQYQPHLVVYRGQAQYNLSNNVANLNTQFLVSPRLTLYLSDKFAHYSDQALFQELTLQTNFDAGTLVRSNYPVQSGSFTTNYSEIGLTYQINPRSSVTFAPHYTFISTEEVVRATEKSTYGADMRYSYRLSARSNIGAMYTWQRSIFTRFVPTTDYHTAQLTYSRDLGRRWSFGGAVGASTSTPLEGSGSRTILATGEASLIKEFGTAALAITYARSNDVGTQVSNGFADRYDVSYTKRLSPVVSASLGGGHYTEFLSIGTPNTSGTYATTRLNVRLSGSTSLTLLYSFNDQNNAGNLLVSGTRHQIAVGLHWVGSREDR